MGRITCTWKLGCYILHTNLALHNIVLCGTHVFLQADATKIQVQINSQCLVFEGWFCLIISFILEWCWPHFWWKMFLFYSIAKEEIKDTWRTWVSWKTLALDHNNIPVRLLKPSKILLAMGWAVLHRECHRCLQTSLYKHWNNHMAVTD